jgi:hypothetical protein
MTAASDPIRRPPQRFITPHFTPVTRRCEQLSGGGSEEPLGACTSSGRIIIGCYSDAVSGRLPG